MRRVHRVVALFWAALAFDRVDDNLGRELKRWDEAIYYNVAENVLRGRWLLPLHSAAEHPISVIDPFLHKPPLSYWLFAASMKLLGQSPSSPRLLSATVTAVLAGIVVLLAGRLGGLLTAIVTGFVYTQMRAPFATHAGSSISTDIFLALFSIAAIYALVLAIDSSQKRESYYAGAAGVLGGLAVLSKGIAAGPIALGCLPFALLVRDSLSRRSWMILFGTSLAVISPWFLAIGILAPDELWQQMVMQQTVGRATGSRFISADGTFSFMRYPYFRKAPWYFGFWWWLLPVAAPIGTLHLWFSTRRRYLYTVAWPLAVTVITIYAFTGNHLWYMLPAAPAIALLSGSLVVEVAYVVVVGLVLLAAS